MARSRTKRHDEYFRIKGYQIIKNITDDDMANRLGCSVRTYRDKILGWSDFKALEAQEISCILGESQDILFFTRDVSKSTHL